MGWVGLMRWGTLEVGVSGVDVMGNRWSADFFFDIFNHPLLSITLATFWPDEHLGLWG